MPRNALGRGLGALIREPEQQIPAAPPTSGSPTAGAAAVQARDPRSAGPHQEQLHGPRQIDIDLLEPSPFQPRTRFREEALEELARSIKASGDIQPPLLRPGRPATQIFFGR